jgi:MoxR-like ATPase
VTTFAARVLKASHPEDETSPQVVRDFVRYGSSPRGMQAMILAGKIFALLDGRYNVAFDDIRQAATPALRHRLILNFEAQAEGMSSDKIIGQILEAVVPEEVR